MACEVKTFANIKDLDKVQQFFGLEHDESWLKAVQYSISPTSELIAMALGEKLVLLASVWDNKSQQATFAPCWSGEIVNSNEIITCVLCLPIFGKSVCSGAEWTCVAVGLSSGFVRFYTDNGILLFSQMFHDSPVTGLKAMFRRETQYSTLYATYCMGLCMVKEEDILPVLMTKKAEHKPAGAYNSKYQDKLDFFEKVPYQKLKYEKNSRSVINDTVVVGHQRVTTFDHIVQKCLRLGPYAKITHFPVQSSLIVSVGTDPYLGLYYDEEGYRPVSVGEVAKDVIGMVYKNVWGSFFGSKSADKSSEEQQPSTEESTMREGSQICDTKRDGFNIWLSPDNQLAVVADNLDRVILVDCQRGVILRIWKGYSDAQCGFIKVKEKNVKGDKSPRRKSLFLIIYAPIMGCIEIWSLQNGPRIAAFTVNKNGQLAYMTHGVMGNGHGTKSKASINSCFFIDPTERNIKEILIPFHFALREDTSKTARDIHLVRRLKSMLREYADNFNSKTLVELCHDFQTDEVRLQCLEMIIKNKKLPPEFFKYVVDSFTSNENEKLQNRLEFYRKLTNFYIAMKNPPENGDESDSMESLSITDNELETVEQIMDLLKDRRSSNPALSLYKVTFQCKNQHDGEFVEYLRVFSELDGCPHLNQDKSLGSISENLFQEYFKDHFYRNHFMDAAIASSIPSEDLIVLALNYWLEKPFNYTSRDDVIKDMTHLGTIVHTICNLAGEKVNSSTYNSISGWWQAVRELLLESCRSMSLLVAIVCRSVAKTIRQTQTDLFYEECDEEMWEQITQDEAQWSLLVGKLDDIAALGAILEVPMQSLDPTMPELPYEPPDCSLKAIVTKGKGVVSDLTCKWLLYSRIHPTKILEKENTANQDDPVLRRLQVLRQHFPFSLESGVIIGLMAWEYMVYWSKNLPSLEHMRASIICLDTFKESDYALKHGMCSIIWNANIKYPLLSTMRMIQKIGYLPRDEVCHKEVGMAASSMSDFLELCLEFLQHFDTSMNHRKRELKFERILADGQLPLHYIALLRNHAIQEILQLHIELCKVLQFIVFFQMKMSAPITSLFDSMSNKTFFVELNKELSYTLPQPDQILQDYRKRFLCRVISASMDLIRLDLEQLYVQEHTCWMDKVCELAELWKLPIDDIKRHQVIEMYAHGWDSYANDLLPNIVEKQKAGKYIAEIAGRRMNLYSNNSGKRFAMVASVGQQLLHYLDKLNENKAGGIQISQTSPDDIDLSLLTKLTTVAYQCLEDKETPLLHIAGQMYDACCVLSH